MAGALITPGIQRLIDLQEWSEPRPIQRKVWSWFTSKEADARDLIVSAPTAVGKTEAIFFPLLDRIARQKDDFGYEILYICPLIALIDQQSKRIAPWAETMGLGAPGLHGSNRTGKNETAKRAGGVLVTTPESLEGILGRGEAESYFRPLRWIVVDELHAFFDSTRGIQIVSQMARIDGFLGPGKEPLRIAASATLSTDAADAAKAFLRPAWADRVDFVTDDEPVAKRTDFEVVSFVDQETGPDDTAFASIMSEIHSRIAAPLRDDDGDYRKVLMFCNSRALVERVTSDLRRRLGVDGNRIIRPHHGSLDPKEKKIAEDGLRNPEARHMVVSTTTLELGIDIGEIDLVIQIDPGPSVSSLRQRLGRTSRRHGDVGRLMLFVRAANTEIAFHPLAGLHFDLFQSLAQLRLVELKAFEAPRSGRLNLSTFVQQMLSMARQGVCLQDVRRDLFANGPFDGDREDVYRLVISHLGSDRRHKLLPALELPDEDLGADAEIFLDENLKGSDFIKILGTSFVTTTDYVVRLGGTTLGTIPVGHNLRPGDTLIFAGRMLRVRSVQESPATLFVEPGAYGTPPPFAGVGMSPSRLVVRMMYELYLGGRSMLPNVELCQTSDRLVDQAWEVVRRHKLDTRRYIELDSGDGVVVLPWSDYTTLTTLALILRSQGVHVVETGVSLVLPDFTAVRTKEVLTTVANGHHPPADLLIRSLPTYKFDRYDHLLSQYCQRLNYVSARVDVDGARRAAAAVAATIF